MDKDPHTSSGDRRYTAPSPMDQTPTEELHVAPGQGQDAQPDKEKKHEKLEVDFAIAFGETVASKLPKSMVDRINKSDVLRAKAKQMEDDGVGRIIEGRPELVQKLLAGFGLEAEVQAKNSTEPAPSGAETTETPDNDDTETDEDKLHDEYVDDQNSYEAILASKSRILDRVLFARYKWQKKWREASFQRYRQRNPDMSLDDAAEKFEKRRAKRHWITLGAGAAALVGAGLVARYGFDHQGNGGSGGDTPDALGGGTGGGGNTEYTNFRDYFNAPDPSKMLDKLHHANDLTPGIPGLSGLDKDASVATLEEYFRGNPNITASWASHLGIDGAPEMPPIDQLQSSDAAVISYNERVNEWADYLRNNPAVRKDVTEQMVSALRDGELGQKITLRPGYLSSGSNNTLGTPIYGTDPGEVFVDPYVGYSNTEAVEWTVNGKTILVEPHCGQIAFQPQEVAQSTPVYNAPAQHHVAPPAHSTPPAPRPEVPSPTQPTPETPPVQPEVPTPEPETPPPSLPPKGVEFGRDATPMGPGDLKPPAPVERHVEVPVVGGRTIIEDITAPSRESSAQVPSAQVEIPTISGPSGSVGDSAANGGKVTGP